MQAEPGVDTLGLRLPQILDARYCVGQSTKVVGASPYRVLARRCSLNGRLCVERRRRAFAGVSRPRDLSYLYRVFIRTPDLGEACALVANVQRAYGSRCPFCYRNRIASTDARLSLEKAMKTSATDFIRLFLSVLEAVQSGRRAKAGQLFALVIIAVLCLSGCTKSRKETVVENTPELARAIATLRDAYSAFNRGDMDATVRGLDPQIEWTEPAEFPGGRTYHGRDGVKQYLTQSRAAWADISSEPERFINAGDRIVVFVHARLRAKDSKEWQDVKLADVYTVRGGEIVGMRAFADRQEALRWVGQ